MEHTHTLSKVKRYHGVVVPMVTPFTPDGDLDEPAVRGLIDHLVSGGVAGIFVLGTTGEDGSIPLPMRARLVALTVEQVCGRATTYAGISHNCLSSSMEAAETYRRQGIDVLVARLPTYYVLTGEEQHAYFETLVGGIPGPLMLYNITATTHMPIPVDVVQALSHNPKVVGIKDSDNNPSRLNELLERLGGRDDFSVLVGVSALAAKALSLGADGFVPSQGNLVPGVCQHLYERGAQGDGAAAKAYQGKLDEVSDLVRAGRSLAQSLGLLKAAMGAISLCGPDVLPPLPTPSNAQQGAVRRAFLQWLARQPGNSMDS